MAELKRWTSSDLELLPEDGKRYEIIDGELYVSRHAGWYHQDVGFELGFALRTRDRQAGLGVTSIAPGVIFAEDDDVIPDLIWISNERLVGALDAAGHLRVAPDLVVEILSPGLKNERRDREAKLKLYSRRGVREYWIADWRQRQIEVYRRDGIGLELVATLLEADVLSSPLLPGFSLPVARVFASVPRI